MASAHALGAWGRGFESLLPDHPVLYSHLDLIMSKKRDHSQLLCNVGELSGLFADASSLEAFLQKTVEMVADHMQTDVCSIYLYSEEKQELVLTATKGLKKEAAKNVRLKLGEGLTGLSLKEMRPICERDASGNHSFKYFPEIGEEPFESFLSVPILRGQTRIGVLVVQNSQKNYFTNADINACKVIASQLANTLEMTKILAGLKEPPRQPPAASAKSSQLKFIKARVGAEGFAFAEAAVYERDISLSQMSLTFSCQTMTIADFHEAVKRTTAQLEKAQKQVEEKLGDVASLIFTAQLLMLKDEEFIRSIEHQIEQQVPVRQAIMVAVKRYVTMFESLPNDYLKEKKYDVLDVGLRLLGCLEKGEERADFYKSHIVIAQELYPSEILKLYSQNIKGLILLSGGVTSHLSILAASLEIPLIITDEDDLLHLPPHTKICIDGEQGHIFISPQEDVLKALRQKEADRSRLKASAPPTRAQTVTADGERVTLLANINLLSDLKTACAYQAEGVGLYRTEFPFIIRSSLPTEEEQYVIYKKLADDMQGKEVTFRTLDIGGDKVLSYYCYAKEENPFLGMRSIRFSLRHKEVFQQQLKAILRAGTQARLRIMFPMISSVEEFLEAKEEVRKTIKELESAGCPHHPSPEVGMMIELPAVLEIIDDLTEFVDFFSIGTNDFIQYMLAVDRTNEKVADLYLPHHPAIIRSLKRIVEAAKARNKDVSICGQMAQDERYTAFFLGIGIRKFSLDPHHLSKIQEGVARINLKSAEAMTQELLHKQYINDIQSLIAEPP